MSSSARGPPAQKPHSGAGLSGSLSPRTPLRSRILNTGNKTSNNVGRVSDGLHLRATLEGEKRGGETGTLGSILAEVKKEEPWLEPVLG